MNSTKTVRVLLVDDHTLVRAGFRMLLQQIDDVQVVTEASDGREALRLPETLQPHLVLMDIGMAGMNGLEATRQIHYEFPQVRVMVLSMYATEDYVIQALRAGAGGYLLKDAAVAELELALKAVMRGETYLSAAVSKVVIDDYLRRLEGKNKGAKEDPWPTDLLTPRQWEILQLIAEGRTTKEIAALLQVTENTVETHRRRLMARLGVHDVAGLVRAALRLGVVP